MMKHVVAVKFQKEYGGIGEKEYHFFALEDVQVNDSVVVETVNGLRIAQVSRLVSPDEKIFANKYIVQKIDKESYLKKVKAEEERSDLEARLVLALEKSNKKSMYEQLIATSENPEVKEIAEKLLKELD